MRCVIWNVLDLRDNFGDITIVYGARTVADLVYKRELAEWAGARATCAGHHRRSRRRDPGLEGRDRLRADRARDRRAPASRDTVALVCGPPIMIKFTLPVLAKLGFAPEHIYTTLENRMKCGVGKCGRCNVGKHLRLQGRPGLHRRPGEGTAAGVLIRNA